MSGRISNERLAELIEYWRQPLTFRDLDVGNALEELQQSRALVTELRALAERMRTWYDWGSLEHVSEERLGRKRATMNWLSELDSLLSSHDAQQAEGK